MKQLKYWFMALVAILATCSLTACSDDDEGAQNSLIGTWDDTNFRYCFEAGGMGWYSYSPSSPIYQELNNKSYFTWYATDEFLSITFEKNQSFQGSSTYYYEIENNILVMVNSNYGAVYTYQRVY